MTLAGSITNPKWLARNGFRSDSSNSEDVNVSKTASSRILGQQMDLRTTWTDFIIELRPEIGRNDGLARVE